MIHVVELTWVQDSTHAWWNKPFPVFLELHFSLRNLEKCYDDDQFNPHCGSFDIQTIQCINQGSDGSAIQWSCNAELSGLYKFKEININCEGYDSPEDTFILKGSCAIQYTLDYAIHDFVPNIRGLSPN